MLIPCLVWIHVNVKSSACFLNHVIVNETMLQFLSLVP
jgi:hypothetical protein